VATVQETLEVGDRPVTAVLSDDAGGAIVLELTGKGGASILRLRATPGAPADPDVPWLVPWTVEAGAAAAMAPVGTVEASEPPLRAALSGLTGRAEVETTGFGLDVRIVQGREVTAEISAERYPDGDLHLNVDPSDLVVCD
jgi:hypothetical protein